MPARHRKRTFDQLFLDSLTSSIYRPSSFRVLMRREAARPWKLYAHRRGR